jgi:hypothetical protein
MNVVAFLYPCTGGVAGGEAATINFIPRLKLPDRDRFMVACNGRAMEKSTWWNERNE